MASQAKMFHLATVELEIRSWWGSKLQTAAVLVDFVLAAACYGIG
jgi:hypothetical protein